ncbi:hypothetical protein J2W48_004521, partial [Flavobacterium piscis]|nr:hypothetical protein [Flavobacterium piscis]
TVTPFCIRFSFVKLKYENISMNLCLPNTYVLKPISPKTTKTYIPKNSQQTLSLNYLVSLIWFKKIYHSSVLKEETGKPPPLNNSALVKSLNK